MSYYTKKPVFDWDKDWEQKSRDQLPKPIELRLNGKTNYNVYIRPDEGKESPEYLVTVTLKDYRKAVELLKLKNVQLFDTWPQCLRGTAETYWQQE